MEPLASGQKSHLLEAKTSCVLPQEAVQQPGSHSQGRPELAFGAMSPTHSGTAGPQAVSEDALRDPAPLNKLFFVSSVTSFSRVLQFMALFLVLNSRWFFKINVIWFSAFRNFKL